jgi:hypothetical protein
VPVPRRILAGVSQLAAEGYHFSMLATINGGEPAASAARLKELLINNRHYTSNRCDSNTLMQI